MKKLIAPILLFSVALFGQQDAVITGQVTNSLTGEPLPGANVMVELTIYGSATDVNGEYSITVPASSVQGQQVSVMARFIGFRDLSSDMTLNPGSQSQDFSMIEDVLEMDAIIVTGVAEETPKTKLTFSVGHVSQAALESVPTFSAESALRGKVAGVKIVRGSGEPGRDASVLLRAPTSINSSGRSQDPLYIVDGVLVDPSVSGSPLSDINADDIVSIDVVKGAAGASLYGSRAANGVVNITTNRGKGLARDITNVKIRSEYGFNELRKDYPLRKSHFYRVAESSYTDANGVKVDSGDFIDRDGNFVDPRGKGLRIGDRYTGNWDVDNPDEQDKAMIFFADKPYKYISTGDILLDANLQPILENGKPKGLRTLPGGKLISQMDQFFDPGAFLTNSATISRNSEATNFSLSFSNRVEDGVIEGLNGYGRQTFRLAVDHKIRPNLTASVSTYYGNVDRDDIYDGVGGSFFGMVFTGGDADLQARHAPVGTITYDYNSTTGFPDGIPQDVGGELFINADPTSERDNPVYEPQTAEMTEQRSRLMGGTTLTYRPVDWFKLEGNLSYDRSNRELNRFFRVGYQDMFDTDIAKGRYIKYPQYDEALNGHFTATLQRSLFNNNLTITTKVRALFETLDRFGTYGRGTGLAVRGVVDLGVASSDMLQVNSYTEQIRSEGYFLISSFDLKDRYLGDVMVRRDVSSLFGPDTREQDYYRVSGAWRLSEEPFWFLDAVQEFKLRGSLGTAGGRPNFYSRYETWTVSSGNVSKGTLGNKGLMPEYSTETEFGLDMAFLNRFTLEITKAHSDVENQILSIPLASYYGYQNQWQNAGTLSTDTWEFSLQGNLVRTRDLSLTFGFLLDQTEQIVSKLGRAPYIFAPGDTQGLRIFRIEEGVEFGALWGSASITDPQELLERLDGVAASAFPLSEFDTNDEGYVVWVGSGNTWKDGIAKELWGTWVELQTGVDDDGEPVMEKFEWGIPIDWENVATGQTSRKIGSTVPDFNWSVFSNFDYKGFSVYSLFDAQVGGDLYSQTIAWGYGIEQNQGKADQTGRPDYLKKPTKYFQNSNRNHFIFDAGYVKLRELAVKYTFKSKQANQPLLGVFSQIGLGVIGRNLLTWDNYDEGYDPEVGIVEGEGGSAVVAKIDAFRYPNYRTFTGFIEVKF